MNQYPVLPAVFLATEDREDQPEAEPLPGNRRQRRVQFAKARTKARREFRVGMKKLARARAGIRFGVNSDGSKA